MNNRVRFDILELCQIKQMNLLKAEMENLHIDFQVAMKNAEYAKAEEIAKAIGTKKTEMMIKNIEHQEQIMNLLSDKQKETYKELFRPEKFKKGRMENKGMPCLMPNCHQ